MPLTPEQVRQGILHPECEVRNVCAAYFATPACDDTSVMPVVIESVQRYGPRESFDLLRKAENLPQTPQTIQWLVDELTRDFDPKDLVAENHHFAVALILLDADADLTVSVFKRIEPHVPQALKASFNERMRLHFSDWAQCWATFEEFGRQTLANRGVDIDDMRRVEHILAALARHREDGVDHVLRLLRKQYARDEKRLMQWMSPWIVKLAGYMHLSKAIPLLLDCLSEEAEVADEVGPALASIGTEEVVQAVSRKWWQAEMMGRFGLTEPLEKIHCGLALERALAFLDREAHFEVQMQLGHAVLGHFHECGIEPVRQMVTGRDDDLDNEQRDLRHKLVAVATAMGADFPEYKAWHKDAVQTDYGWGDRPVVPIRLAFEGDMDAVLTAYKPR